MGRPAIDLKGKRLGKLTVIERVENIPKHHARWLCKCDCGNTHIVESHCLIGGSVTSCGCNLVVLHTTHGRSGSRLYTIWNGIKQRCLNENTKDYPYYGGRGITICDEWKNDFESFEKWALFNGYDAYAKRGECTLDRIDNDGNYEPSNCRWVTMKEQCKNRRRPKNWKKAN